ncbi:substrate-binding domain-containing protein [Epibacterium ulvae]|uniref:substrate-binding domain-containing protein n=1 Tax=Epibacterium ulvae TaxID=1156985 RepID=UPI001BFC28B8|nr:substrate-binding domain-containing protein [Epibacterium ulvae]MBT8153181.1 substrate-binding domain-containing protein [Epibacterium ulvae]
MKHLLLSVVVALTLHTPAWAEAMKLAVTTSFHNSGLAEILLPEIKRDLGFEVQLLVVGTGQAIRLGEAGDVDAILVHSRAAEVSFLASGHGTHRREIMYNDFVFVGPKTDVAGVKTAQNAQDALSKIANAEAVFVSRGDDSGTHKKELSLWEDAGLDPERFGRWYRAVGAGMGAALNTAAALDAYIMADRASWLNFGNTGDLALLYAGDPDLFNQYAYVPVNAERHSHVKTSLVDQLENWLISDKAKGLIDDYQINGETLFVFNAKR